MTMMMGASLAAPYVPGAVRGIGRGIQYAGGGLGQRLQGLGQQYLPQGVQDALGGAGNAMGGLYNAVFNPEEEMTPERQAQQAYLQRIQQPFQLGTAQRQQQMMNNFNQNILPGIRNQFAGAGVGQRSSAFGQQLGSAGADLQSMLGALGEQNALQEEQMNQGRGNQLAGFLGGQQNLAMQAQEMGQRGTIAQQNNQLQRMLQMANYNTGQQEQTGNQQQRYANIMGGLGNQAQGQQFDTRHFAGQPAGYQELVRQLGPAAARAMMVSLGMPNQGNMHNPF